MASPFDEFDGSERAARSSVKQGRCNRLQTERLHSARGCYDSLYCGEEFEEWRRVPVNVQTTQAVKGNQVLLLRSAALVVVRAPHLIRHVLDHLASGDLVAVCDETGGRQVGVQGVLPTHERSGAGSAPDPSDMTAGPNWRPP